MPDALDLDSIAAQMKAAAERAIATPGEPDRKQPNWQAIYPALPIRTDLTGARVVASNPEHILAILAEREALTVSAGKRDELRKEHLDDVSRLAKYLSEKDEALTAARALLAKAEEAMEPFAQANAQMEIAYPKEADNQVYDYIGPQKYRNGEWGKADSCVPITHGDFRRARAVLDEIRKAHL